MQKSTRLGADLLATGYWVVRALYFVGGCKKTCLSKCAFQIRGSCSKILAQGSFEGSSESKRTKTCKAEQSFPAINSSEPFCDGFATVAACACLNGEVDLCSRLSGNNGLWEFSTRMVAGLAK